MSSAFERLKVEEEDNLVVLTLNRPHVLNAVDTRMAQELSDFFSTVGDGDVRCVILTGAGERAFCAGADLKERRTMSDGDWSRQHLVYERMIEAVLSCPIPIVAAVNGLAYGGGGELVAASDFAYAARSARFAQRETALAIFPGAGGTQMFPRVLGPKRANEMILSGQAISAEVAYEWGLINRICENGAVLDAARETARAICGNGPLAVRQAKKAMKAAVDVDLATGLMIEREAYHRLIGSADRREGIAAFNEKRNPRFIGR